MSRSSWDQRVHSGIDAVRIANDALFADVERLVVVHGVAHGWRHILHFRNVSTERFPAVSSHSKSSILHVLMGRKKKKVRLEPQCVPPTHLPLGTSTHVAVRVVRGTYSVSSNGVVQRTTD